MRPVPNVSTPSTNGIALAVSAPAVSVSPVNVVMSSESLAIRESIKISDIVVVDTSVPSSGP